MNRSLSVLLPVHNAQATLAADVAKVLDVLPDLTHRFDILIIDDASTDATSEVAHELVTQYPQVKFMRHSRQRGVEESLQFALARSDSEVVLGHQGTAGLDAAEIVRLWHQRHEMATTARTPAVGTERENGSWLTRWFSESKESTARRSPAAEFRLLRRDVGTAPTRPIHSIRRIESPASSIGRSASPPALAGRSKFLSRIKEFTLGE